MLAELRRRHPHGHRAVGHLHGRPDVGHAAELGILGVHDHLAVQHLRIGEELLVGVHGPARHARVVQRLDPVRGGRRGQDRRDLLLEGEAILPAIGAAAEARVLEPLGMAEGGRAALPDALAGRADHHVAVLGLEALVRRVLPMAGAHSLGLHVIGEPARARPRGKGHRRLQERALDALSLARALPLVEGGEDALHSPHAGAEIADGQAHRGRRPVRLSRDVHDPAHALRDQIEAALLAIGPIRAEAGKLGIDEARVLLLERLEAEPGPLHDGGAVVFHEHVHAGDELEEDLLAAGRLVIERQAFLVAVDVAEVGIALAAVAHGARGIARPGPLHLDHVGAHVGQDHGAVRPRHVLGQVENLEPIQGPARVLLGHVTSVKVTSSCRPLTKPEGIIACPRL